MIVGCKIMQNDCSLIMVIISLVQCRTSLDNAGIVDVTSWTVECKHNNYCKLTEVYSEV